MIITMFKIPVSPQWHCMGERQLCKMKPGLILYQECERLGDVQLPLSKRSLHLNQLQLAPARLCTGPLSPTSIPGLFTQCINTVNNSILQLLPKTQHSISSSTYHTTKPNIQKHFQMRRANKLSYKSLQLCTEEWMPCGFSRDWFENLDLSVVIYKLKNHRPATSVQTISSYSRIPEQSMTVHFPNLKTIVKNNFVTISFAGHYSSVLPHFRGKAWMEVSERKYFCLYKNKVHGKQHQGQMPSPAGKNT